MQDYRHPIVLGTLLLAGIIGLSIAAAPRATGATATGLVAFRVGAQINKTGLAVSFWINDVLAYRNDSAEYSSGGVFFTEWLVPGENKLRYEISAASGGGAPELTLDFFRQEDAGGVAALGSVVLTALPMSGEFIFGVDDLPSAPPFMSAHEVAVDDARSAVLAEVASLFEAVAARDAASLMAKLELSARASAPFYGTEPSEMVARMTGAIGMLLQRATPLPTYSESDYALESVGKGRMILVTRKDMEAVLSLSDPAEPMMRVEFVRLFFAKLDGRWVVVHT